MSTSTIGKFDFSLICADEKAKILFDPWVRIQVQQLVHGTSEDDAISPRLMTEREIDDYIAALKANLDAVGVRAKKGLQAARAETLKRASQGPDDLAGR